VVPARTHQRLSADHDLQQVRGHPGLRPELRMRDHAEPGSAGGGVLRHVGSEPASRLRLLPLRSARARRDPGSGAAGGAGSEIEARAVIHRGVALLLLSIALLAFGGCVTAGLATGPAASPNPPPAD